MGWIFYVRDALAENLLRGINTGVGEVELEAAARVDLEDLKRRIGLVSRIVARTQMIDMFNPSAGILPSSPYPSDHIYVSQDAMHLLTDTTY
jgi:hypothetical protein